MLLPYYLYFIILIRFICTTAETHSFQFSIRFSFVNHFNNFFANTFEIVLSSLLRSGKLNESNYYEIFAMLSLLKKIHEHLT